MSIRVITYSGTLQLGRPAPDAPPCQAPQCGERAQLELDIPTAIRGMGKLRLVDTNTRRVALCAQHLADAAARGLAA